MRYAIHKNLGTSRVWDKESAPFFNKDVLAKVITHILQNGKEKEIFLDIVNGYTDHLHCLVSLSASLSIAKTVNLIKGESSFWINKNKLTTDKFEWADEYYAVSVSESQIDKVREYIRNQQEHHIKLSYSDECKNFMQKYGWKYLG